MRPKRNNLVTWAELLIRRVSNWGTQINKHRWQSNWIQEGRLRQQKWWFTSTINPRSRLNKVDAGNLSPAAPWGGAVGGQLRPPRCWFWIFVREEPHPPLGVKRFLPAELQTPWVIICYLQIIYRLDWTVWVCVRLCALSAASSSVLP